MHLPPELVRLARAHHGLVTLVGWRAHGLGRSSFYRSCDHGLLVPMGAGVAALVGTPVTTVTRVAAAVLAYGPAVMASHRSSAWLWGAPVRGDDPVELLTTAHHRRSRRPDVVIHRPTGHTQVRSVRRYGIATTSPLRALLDLGASAPEAVAPTLEQFLRSGIVTFGGVRAALQRHRRKGRHGVAALAAALDDLAAEGAVTDSELETVMRRVFRRAGLDGWELHPRVAGFEVDFCFRTERVVVEVDGWWFHADRRRDWEQGLERDLVLQAAGWLVSHVTWRMATRRPDPAAERLRATLARRR